MGLDLRPSSHCSCFHVAVSILCLFSNEHTPLALRASASLAAAYTLNFKNVYRTRNSTPHILLPLPSSPSMLCGHLQAFPPAISMCGCGYRSYWVLAIFAVPRNPKGLPSTPALTSFRGPYSSCSHTACYLRSSNDCISSSFSDQGLPGSSP